MNKQRTAALLLIGTTLLWAAFASSLKGMIVFGATLVGQISMWIVLTVAQREERRIAAKKKGIGILAGLMALIQTAKAVLIVVIVVGGIVGLLGWGAIEVWSKALSIKLNQLKKPGDVAQLTGVTTGIDDDGVGGVAASPEEEEQNFAIAADEAEWVEPTGLYLSILVPANTILEYSQDMDQWYEIHWSGTQDEMTFWEPQGEKGFFRLKSWQTDDEPTNDPRL